MEFRKAKFNQYGTIDCEINDHQFGWIPFTASSDDIYSVGHEVFEAAKDVADPYIPPTPEENIASERARMIASRRQIRLALGEAGCEAMDAAANDLAYPWAIRDQMKSAHEWHRTAQEIDEFGWIMGLSADEIDALFVQAMAF